MSINSASLGWVNCFLGDVIVRVVGGGTPSRGISAYWMGNIPWASVKDFTDDAKYIQNTEEHISFSGLANSAANLIEAGIPVICTRMAVGRAAITGNSIAINQDLKALYLDNNINSKYLLLLLKFLRPKFESLSIGSTVKGINIYQLLTISISLPPLYEQRHIAEILDTVDDAIARTSSLIIKLKQTKAGLLQDLLTRGLDNDGKLRDPQAHPEQFKGSPLGRIPKDWEVFLVSDCILKIEQGWSPDCESFTTPLGEWGVLKTTSVVWEGYQNFENKRLPSHLEPDPNYEVKPGDVLMTRAGPNSRVGVVALVSQTQGKLMLSDKLYRLVPRELIKPDFLVYTLSGSQTQSHLSTLKTGLAESQTNISQEIVRSLLIILPSLKEQANIISILDTQDTRIRTEEAYVNKLKLQKQGLMQDLLTGKVRVKNL